MHFADWLLTLLCIALVLGMGAYTQRYMKSVADFLSGGRLAGRYLLTVSKGEMQAGAVVFVAMFELISESGFTTSWWWWIQTPITLVVAIFGFVVYRYRETRAMTLAQFFEIRYSKKFRLFTGVLGFLAGILNFGIIPGIAARFIVYFWGLPLELTLLGHALPTFIPLMGLFLAVTLLITLAGGLITVMVTDCLEGILSQLFYLIIVASMIAMFSWGEINEVLSSRPPGHSMLNPFDSMGLKNFNLWYVLMSSFIGVYGTMAWQNASAYNAAALNAHESRMSSLLGRWREMGKSAVVTLLAICAVTFLQHHDFAAQSAHAHQLIGDIANPQLQKQLRVPIALSELLPIGIKGLLSAIMLMGIFGGDSTHLHSWGGILVQDVLVPLRRKPLSPRQHIRYLRLAVTGVAVFAFLFGSLFRQTEYVLMWWNVTMGIYVGGAGAAIIGGLYWKKGTTAGAWAALLTGSLLSGGGIIVRQIYGDAFPLNGLQISFGASLLAIIIYIVVSLFTCREDFNLERMLHRGVYATTSNPGEAPAPAPRGQRSWFGRLIGFDENFTRGDKWIAGLLFAWSVTWFFVMIFGSLWNLIAPWPLAVWSNFWRVVGIWLPVLLCIATGIWFTWGGLHDLRALFRRLAHQKVNDLDNGTVVGHRNLDEVEPAVQDTQHR